MRLTLWQQYSSNHSASFMIVGRFESAEWAATVAAEIRAMLTEISVWWAQYIDNWEDVEKEIREQHHGLTPPEVFYKNYYAIDEWGVGREGVLDWVQSPKAADAVRTFANFVIVGLGVDGIGDTWAGAKPFDKILQVLGGNVIVQGEQYDHYLGMNLTCLAPDEATAQKIMLQATYMPMQNAILFHLAQGLYPTRGRVRANGREILLEHYQFHDNYDPPNTTEKWLFEEELTRVLDYFRGQGCTDIEYDFLEVPYP
jgi:hypothetical protein